MPERIRDPELEQAFDIEVDEEHPEVWTVTCKAPGCTHAWDLNVRHRQFKGARNAVLQHARHHTEIPAMRARHT